MALEIRGGEQLARLAKDLKAAGEKDLAKELNAGLRGAMEPSKTRMQASARTNLPSRGGFNRKVAAARFNIRVSTSRGIRLVASHRYQLKLIDQGGVRHPLFGDRGHWYLTRFAPGVFTNPFEEMAPQLRDQLNSATQNMANKIGR